MIETDRLVAPEDTSGREDAIDRAIRPRKLEEYVGQPGVREQMEIFIAAARQRNFDRLGWDFNRRGFQGAPRLRVIASRQAHGTVSKAIALLNSR